VFRQSLKMRSLTVSPELYAKLVPEMENKVRWALGSTLSRPYGAATKIGLYVKDVMPGLLSQMQKDRFIEIEL